MAKKSGRRERGGGCLFQRVTNGTYYARWQSGGKVYVRSCQTNKRREAEKRLEEYTAVFRLGGELATVKALADKAAGIELQIEAAKDGEPALTVLAAWDRFVVSPKGKNPRGRAIAPGERTLDDYKGRWIAFVTWLDNHYPTEKNDLGVHVPRELRAITSEQAQRYINEIGLTRSTNTRNKTLIFLKLIFNVLAKEARVKENPFNDIAFIKYKSEKKRKLEQSELWAVADQLRGKGEMELLFYFGLYTGARLGDCVTMRWKRNVKMEDGVIEYTPSKTQKTSEGITLRIVPALYSLLNSIPPAKRRGHVMPELAKLYETRSGIAILCRRIQKVFANAGIETGYKVKGYSREIAQVGFHSLRHYHITELLNHGAPLESVRKRVGHASTDMTAHYFKDTGEAVERAMLALPDVTHANTLPAVTDATGAKLGAVLAMLDGLNDAELSEVIKQAGSIISGRADK